MSGSVYLLGAGLLGGARPNAAFQHMLERTLGTVKGRKPRVALSLAPIADNAGFVRKAAGWFTAAQFCGADVHRFAVAGEPGAMPEREARDVLEAADLVFISGGDPVVGARILVESGADAWLREARARGASLAGGSAGAIVLGAFWAEWPEEAPPGAPFDGGTLVRCTGVAGDVVVDTHDEEGGWSELQLIAGMLRATGHTARLRGVPTLGGLCVAPDGTLTDFGDPCFVLD